MKRPSKSQTSQVTPSRRSLRIETLEDRKLMTVAAEMVQMPQESQIGSEHWPEPAAEIAVEKATNDRQGFFSRGLHNNGAFRGSREIGFSRGLHNNGAFREPTGHVLWNTADDAGTSSNSYTDSGRITYYAYELKNVQVTSVVDQEANPVSNNGDQAVPTDLSFTAGIPSCPEFQAGADIVMEELEHGPGLHDSVHCLAGQQAEKLGGQEGEPVTENQFSLNFEEIKENYTEYDDAGSSKGNYTEYDDTGSSRVNNIVGGTMCSARASNDPVFFSHHANIDAIWGGNVTLMTGREIDDSFTPTTDLPDGDYYLQGKSQPTNQFSLNFEEIKVTYNDSGNQSDVLGGEGESADFGLTQPHYYN